MKHKHHLIPKHVGGTNDSTNIVEVTVIQHAMFHFANWQLWGRDHDRLAWRGLAGLISADEIALEAMSQGGKIGGAKGGKNQPREVKIANMMKTRQKLTPEALARGGRNGPPGKHVRAGTLGGQKVARKVKVTRLSDGETREFPSAKVASEWVGCLPASITNVVKGRRRQCRGFIAEYLI